MESLYMRERPSSRDSLHVQNRTLPPLDYGRVRKLKREFPKLHIELNGGLNSISLLNDVLTWADGVMVGRRAYEDFQFLATAHNHLFFETQKDLLSNSGDRSILAIRTKNVG